MHGPHTYAAQFSCLRAALCHRNYRACVRAHKMALSAQRSFWMALLHDTIQFKSLQKTFIVMNTVWGVRMHAWLCLTPTFTLQRHSDGLCVPVDLSRALCMCRRRHARPPSTARCWSATPQMGGY